ncbi:TPA: hypothetical protein ACYSEX_005573 [Klebsiella pneumoniae]
MHLRKILAATVLLPCFCFAANQAEVFRDSVTLTGGAKNLSELLEGCESHSGVFLAKRFQYSDSGNTIKLIQFQRGDGQVFAIPTNFDSLSKSQYGDVSGILSEGNKYWITFSVCGSGGFTSLMDISYSLGM